MACVDSLDSLRVSRCSSLVCGGLPKGPSAGNDHLPVGFLIRLAYGEAGQGISPEKGMCPGMADRDTIAVDRYKFVRNPIQPMKPCLRLRSLTARRASLISLSPRSEAWLEPSPNRHDLLHTPHLAELQPYKVAVRLSSSIRRCGPAFPPH